jgi:hypothetical protein
MRALAIILLTITAMAIMLTVAVVFRDRIEMGGPVEVVP